mmetsp:Transcript_32562/g.83258  ORF Transcript_32562/g.83258 Transcript_32562/m.83258 type:complete len:213 (+) Transcript_32562:343-981(+)
MTPTTVESRVKVMTRNWSTWLSRYSLPALYSRIRTSFQASSSRLRMAVFSPTSPESVTPADMAPVTLSMISSMFISLSSTSIVTMASSSGASHTLERITRAMSATWSSPKRLRRTGSSTMGLSSIQYWVNLCFIAGSACDQGLSSLASFLFSARSATFFSMHIAHVSSLHMTRSSVIGCLPFSHSLSPPHGMSHSSGHSCPKLGCPSLYQRS